MWNIRLSTAVKKCLYSLPHNKFQTDPSKKHMQTQRSPEIFEGVVAFSGVVKLGRITNVTQSVTLLQIP